MDRQSEKEKSSRKYRDAERHHRDDRRRSDKRSSREYSVDRDKSPEPRSEREGSRERVRERSHDRHKRESREYSVDRDNSVEPRGEREGSRERVRERSHDRHKREKSHDLEKRSKLYDREDSVERRHSKRKDREETNDDRDADGKRARVSEKKERRKFEEDTNGREKERKERRRFEDGDEPKENREEKRERRRFEDRVKQEEGMEVDKEKKGEEFKERHVKEVDKEKKGGEFEDKHLKKELKEDAVDNGNQNRGGSITNGAVMESLAMASRSSFDTPLSQNHAPATKVSSISTTNENKGVNINRSHEVPGKSSTDGTASDAGKTGGFSGDALIKAKIALQRQKEIAAKLEKLKKIPVPNKDTGKTREVSPQFQPKESVKMPSTSSGILPAPPQFGSDSVTTSAGVTSTMFSAAYAASVSPPPSGVPPLAGLTTQKFEAVKRVQELVAQMGFRQDPEFDPLVNMFRGQMPPEVSIQPKPSKAPVLRLDPLGREVDEHGNVLMPKINNLSTLKVNINKQKKDAFQILKPELEVDPEKNPHFDARMGINKDKLLRPKRMSFQFVEEGKWTRDAEQIKLRSQFGELRAKELKAKQAQLAKAKSEPDINPNLIEVSERVVTKEKPKEEPIPEIEWWDMALLLSGNYDGIIDGHLTEDKLRMEKFTIYVEHPRPIEPPAEAAPPPPQPLKLTKKEQKKLRTQRRLAKEKEKQEMIRQGLIEPPKPKVKMSNLMKVLGSEATQDPTKLEMEIRSAAAEREQAHIDRNIARKLTPAERREKKEKKLFSDPNNLETIVSVYKINDLSHPQARFKVDANAHQNRLTGCAVISEGISVVVVEGGPKSIKRYGKLMLRRIDWAAAVKNEDEDGEEETGDAPTINKCLLVWQGNVAKPSFNRFSIHDCRTETAARKIFSDAGVAHYWDLAVNFREDQI